MRTGFVGILALGLFVACSDDTSSSGAGTDTRAPLLAAETGWTRIGSVPWQGKLTAGVGYQLDDLTVDQGSLAVVYHEQFIQITNPTAITTAIRKATFALAGGAPVITETHFDQNQPGVIFQKGVHAHFVNGLAAQLTQLAPISNRAASQLTEIDENGTNLTTIAVPDIVDVNTTYASNQAIAMGGAYLNNQGYAGLFAFQPAQSWSDEPASLEGFDPGLEAPLPNTVTVTNGGLLPFFANDLTPRAAVLFSDGRFLVLKPDFGTHGFQTELSFAIPAYAYNYADVRSSVYAHLVGYGRNGNVHSFLVAEHPYDASTPGSGAPISLYRWTEGASALEKVYTATESARTQSLIEQQRIKAQTRIFDVDAEGRAYIAVSNTQNEARQISKDGDALLSKTGAIAPATGHAPAYISRVYESGGTRYVVAYTFTHPNTMAEDLQLEIYRYDP